MERAIVLWVGDEPQYDSLLLDSNVIVIDGVVHKHVDLREAIAAAMRTCKAAKP